MCNLPSYSLGWLTWAEDEIRGCVTKSFCCCGYFRLLWSAWPSKRSIATFDNDKININCFKIVHTHSIHSFTAIAELPETYSIFSMFVQTYWCVFLEARTSLAQQCKRHRYRYFLKFIFLQFRPFYGSILVQEFEVLVLGSYVAQSHWLRGTGGTTVPNTNNTKYYKDWQSGIVSTTGIFTYSLLLYSFFSSRLWQLFLLFTGLLSWFVLQNSLLFFPKLSTFATAFYAFFLLKLKTNIVGDADSLKVIIIQLGVQHEFLCKTFSSINTASRKWALLCIE